MITLFASTPCSHDTLDNTNVRVGVRGGLSFALLSWQQIKNRPRITQEYLMLGNAAIRSAFKLHENLLKAAKHSEQSLTGPLQRHLASSRSPCSLLVWRDFFREASDVAPGVEFAEKPCSLPGGCTKIHRTLTAKSMSLFRACIA